MIREIKFDPDGGPLWIVIEMQGLYIITYTYQLWSATVAEPPILTVPIRVGSNQIPHPDRYPVVNDFNPTEPVSAHDGRIIDVRFWVKKADSDDGYNLIVTVKQGPVFESAVVLDDDSEKGNVGSLSVKEEFVTIKLVAA